MDEDILERDEVLNIMLSSMETRVEVSNSTALVIKNDDSEYVEICILMRKDCKSVQLYTIGNLSA